MFTFKRLVLGIILVFSGQNSLNSSEAAVMRIVTSGLRVIGLYLARPEVAWQLLHNQKLLQNDEMFLKTILIDKNSKEYTDLVTLAQQTLDNKVACPDFKISIDNKSDSQLASVTFSMPIASSFYTTVQPSITFANTNTTTFGISTGSRFDSRNLIAPQAREQLGRIRNSRNQSECFQAPQIDEVKECQTVFNNLKTCSKQELLMYLSKPETFAKLLIQSNSINEHDRIYARFMLPYLLEFGPQYNTTYSSLAAVISSYYNDQGQLKTTDIVPGATNKIIYCLKQLHEMGNNNQFKQLGQQVISDPVAKNYTYLQASFDGLILKAKSLGLYGMDPILETYKSDGIDSIGSSYVGNVFWTQDHTLVNVVIANKDNFFMAEELNQLRDAFDINCKADLKKAKEIYSKNSNNPLILATYKSLEKYYRTQFQIADYIFANDPAFKKMKPQLKNLKSDFDKYYDVYHYFYQRHQLKNQFMQLFAIQKGSNQIDEILFKIMDCPNSPDQYMAVLSDIAKNKDLNLNSQELYRAFYLPNGILKSYWRHSFARNFKLNPSLPKNIQGEISLCANKLLGYKAKSSTEDEVVEACVKLLEVANKNVEFKPYLRVAQCSVEALNGNKDYGFILCKPDALKKPKSAIEVYNQIQEVQKSKIVSLQENVNKEKDKAVAPTDQPVEQPKVEEEQKIEKVIKDENEIAELIEKKDKDGHIFSDDHEKRGILDFDPNQNKELIKKEIVNRIKKANNEGSLKEGTTNQIQDYINGKKIEIRVDVKNGKPRGMTILTGEWSTRNLGNIIRFTTNIQSKL